VTALEIFYEFVNLDVSTKNPCRSYHRLSGKVNRFLRGKSSYLIGFNHYRWWLCHQKALPVDELPFQTKVFVDNFRYLKL
jgi:hypothetical protein